MVASSNSNSVIGETSIGILVRPGHVSDAADIARIYNDAIAERTATFETTPRSAEDMTSRLGEDARYPVLVAVRGDAVVGWASLSAYRPRDCYRGVAEFSIYIDREARGAGIGKTLLTSLIAEASRLGYWKLLSRVFPFNTGSLALCRACGFREVGVYQRHAQLDGRWLDVVIVERVIPENQA
jgi:L-amino acid N-acyltransferase YncA